MHLQHYGSPLSCRPAWRESAARATLLATCALLLQLASAAAAAQPAQSAATGPQTRTTTYDRAYFDPFAPRTALDIARRVPGFTVDLGSTQTATGTVDVRGFAGVAGNVVINGARPSSKAETLETLLSRIPAQRVVRVEVAPGDVYGSDYAGKSQVLNVVMSADAGIDANITVAVRRIYSGTINRDLTGSALIKRGASSINLSAGTGNNKQAEEGTDTLTDAATGEPIEFRRKINTYFNRDPYVSASWALERAGDNAVRLNARWNPSKFDLEQRNRVTPEGEASRDDSLYQRYRNPVIELGGDLTRPLAGGAIKLVALATRRKRNDLDRSVVRGGLLSDNAVQVGGFEQTVEATRGETIGRVSWSRGDLLGLSFEVGAEAAYNTLDSSVQFCRYGPGGTKTRIDLPIDQATVKEKRGEVYVSLGKTLSPGLRIDGGLNYEVSVLKVRGDATADRSLRFFKPNLAIDWKPGGGWHTRFAVRRTVAQLNFYDFVSFAELSNDRVNGGNAELLPQRTWEVRGTVDRPVLGEGLLKLEAGVDRVSLLQDQILTDEGFSAPGNIGTGKRRFARLSIDAPLGRLGLTGTTLKAHGQVQRTRVLDPISGRTRNFSDFFPNWEWNIEVRRDAGPLSYGGTYGHRAPFAFFRADEIDKNSNNAPVGTAFVEYRINPRTSVTLDVDNFTDIGATRERLFFDPNRSAPLPDAREVRERNRHMSFGLTLKQSLGGGGGTAKSDPPD